MSEYQDYRWSCVTRSLSRADAKAVSQLSSHITVTAGSAQVDYSYGDFKHNPIKVLEKYFDVFTYEANWGSQTVAFRFDAGTVDDETMALFCHGDTIKVTRTEHSVIIEAGYWEENYLDSHWIPDDYQSSEDERFHRIYRELLQGDFRALFLLWLKSSSHCGPDKRNHSAPIPAGLAELHPEHQELTEFIGLDPDFIQAAAQLPPSLQPTSQAAPNYGKLLTKLPEQRVREILSDLLTEDPASVARSLKAELNSHAPKRKKQPLEQSLIPFKDIEKLATEIKENRERKAKEEEQRAHNAYLESLAQLEPKTWRLVELLISEKKAKTYDQAVEFLHGLRDLYEHRGKTDLFIEKVLATIHAYPSLVGMRDRMKQAGHLSIDRPVERNTNGFSVKQRLSPTKMRQQFIDKLLAEIATRSL